jgi:two-component system, NtrC family, response regulator AtoC
VTGLCFDRPLTTGTTLAPILAVSAGHAPARALDPCPVHGPFLQFMRSYMNSITLDPLTDGFVYGLGAAMQSLNGIVSEIAPTQIPVLIVGESGVGKDAYARVIHRLSYGDAAVLQKINCAAPDSAAVFDNVYQATHLISNPTTAATLYLDNLHELDLASQRALYSHLIEVQGTKGEDRRARRLLSSSLRTLENDVASERFSRELYFHVNGACLRLPPLRERRDDIPILMEYFLTRHSSAARRTIPSVDRRALDTLVSYYWPGNIRELENLALKIVAFGDVQLALQDLQSPKPGNALLRDKRSTQPLKLVSRDVSRRAERQLIMQALERTRWNRKRAAQELQISYKALLYKIKQFGSLTGDLEG